jgi:hypothetical protein
VPSLLAAQLLHKIGWCDVRRRRRRIIAGSIPERFDEPVSTIPPTTGHRSLWTRTRGLPVTAWGAGTVSGVAAASLSVWEMVEARWA